MDLVLFKKNIPILCYHENEEHEITSIKRFFNVAHLPVHLFTDGKASAENEYGICQKLEEFLDSRLIPYNRQKFKDLLTELDLNSADELAKKSFYLSLSDQYWVCDASDMGKIWWEDINFFTNKYDDAIGLRLLFASKALNKNSSSFSPDNTTSGELPKRWFKGNGINYLEKAGTGSEQQEPLNEVLASEICRRLKISYIPYSLKIIDENYYCICPDIADENTEMIPMDSVYQDLHLTQDLKYDYQKFMERCKNLGIPNVEEDFLKIFLLDFIIANEDRHSFNVSFLRKAETLEWIGVAPVYDSGKSMFLNKLDFEINMTSSYRIPAKPFASTQIEQFNLLPMEKLYGKINFNALNGIENWYEKFLSPLRRLSSEKKAALVQKLSERILEAKNLILKKYNETHSDSLPKDKTAAVFNSLVSNPEQTKEEIAAKLGISRATVTRSLSKLVEQGKIKRVGSNKTGRWEIL